MLHCFLFSFAFILGLAFYTTRWLATIPWDVAGMGRSVTSVPGGGGLMGFFLGSLHFMVEGRALNSGR